MLPCAFPAGAGLLTANGAVLEAQGVAPMDRAEEPRSRAE
ncbi:hypothetical protein SAMN02910291_02539 [Desulfovibrio desulfuricans]|uniref:Uncharacterized protein n=2 Tax=Desulfovibrio desulfuricans TaxID=876 RepID=A0AA94L384_DESDE|nr:hypothetical protein SAMN02910291_02539 [Desulfovibrio desulfuricans]SPD35593.1 Hypothetical protein DSVG11_1496 [Desulfovibrio sp. G11]